MNPQKNNNKYHQAERRSEKNNLMRYLRKNRHLLETELLISPKRYLFSPIYFAQQKISVPTINQYVHGFLLDVGCGDMPYRQLLEKLSCRYDTLDSYPRSQTVTFTDDVQNMVSISDSQYDSVLCLEVLEHVPDPKQALFEINRVLRSGGILILSVPHLSRLHDEPHDYYRFTHHGLIYLLQTTGFTLLDLKIRGGLFCFLGHQLSTFILSLVWGIPVIKDIGWLLNSWIITRTCYYIDSLVKLNTLFPQGYVIVAEKQR